MDFITWEASLNTSEPPSELPMLAKALWWEANGNWERGHTIAQDVEGEDGAWVHAYLHRRQGDLTNANYWYRRAGKPGSRDPFEIERKAIVTALLRDGKAAVERRHAR